jgi:hypothetical protein
MNFSIPQNWLDYLNIEKFTNFSTGINFHSSTATTESSSGCKIKSLKKPVDSSEPD